MIGIWCKVFYQLDVAAKLVRRDVAWLIDFGPLADTAGKMATKAIDPETTSLTSTPRSARRSSTFRAQRKSMIGPDRVNGKFSRKTKPFSRAKELG